MESNKPYKITAILCTLMLGAGISIGALLYCLVVKIEKIIINESDSDLVFNPSSGAALEINARVWTVGLLYGFPALMGFISACTKSKGCYIAHMVIEIIALVLGGILFVYGVMTLLVGADTRFGIDDSCLTVGDTCTCGSRTISLSCESINGVMGYAYGLAACFVIGWIVCLIDTIHTGMVACRSTPTPGAMIIGSQPTTTVITTGVSMAPYPNPYSPAPPHYDTAVGNAYSTSDTAVLVKNAE